MKYQIHHNMNGWFVYLKEKYPFDLLADFNLNYCYAPVYYFKTRALARDAILRHKGRQFITGWALKDNDLFALLSSNEFLSLNGKAIFCGEFDKAYKISHEQAIAYNPESVRTLKRICYYWFCETKKEIRSRAVVKDYKYPLGIKYS